MGLFAAVAGAGVIGSWLFGGVGRGLGGVDVGRVDLLVAGGIVILLMSLRRRRVTSAPTARATVGAPGSMDMPSVTAGDHARGDSTLDVGVRDIRQTDPRFEPGRFAGYAGMVFRDAQRAWTTGDIGSLRDRVTPQLHGALLAQCDRLRSARRVNRVERVEITTEITEAWQEGGRDYVTAHIGGSIVDYTVDEVGDSLVSGSRTIPRDVDEFWTFTRQAGLNFWMLSAIQVS